MTICEGRSHGGGRSGGPRGQATVVDADHVVGPLAGREVVCLVEADEPVFGVPFADHEERRLFLADGESALCLARGGSFGFHG